jgi:hypothetical protein
MYSFFTTVTYIFNFTYELHNLLLYSFTVYEYHYALYVSHHNFLATFYKFLT